MTEREKEKAMRRLSWVVTALLFAVASCDGGEQRPRPGPQPKKNVGGRLSIIDGYLVLHVQGSPEEMGEQHGRLLKKQIQRACKALIHGYYPGEWYKRLIKGTKVMEKHQPEEFRRELKALAKAAGIDYWDCVAMQLFGDVDRGQPYVWPGDDGALEDTKGDKEKDAEGREDEKSVDDKPGAQGAASGGVAVPGETARPSQKRRPRDGIKCSSYAVFGPATKTGELMAGRNMDFYDGGVSEYGAILMHVKPDKGHAFVTVTWSGIINGWTLMNEKGIVTANNSSFGATNALEGISTCFMLRKVAQYASTVNEGIAIVRKGPRACGTNMLIAGGTPPDAVIVEFAHKAVAVRRAKKGYVLAANSFKKLKNLGTVLYDLGFGSRYATLHGLIKKHHGKIDRTMNLAGAEGVPMLSNLHSALLFPKGLVIRVSMGKVPAYKYRFRGFRMTRNGLVPEKQ